MYCNNFSYTQIIYLFHCFSISTLIVERRVVIKQLETEIMSPSDLKKFLLQHFQHLELGDSSNRNAEIACTKMLLLNLDGIVLVTPRRYYSPFLRCLLRQLNCSVQNTAVTMQCIVLLYLHDNPLFYGRASSWPSLQQQLI